MGEPDVTYPPLERRRVDLHPCRSPISFCRGFIFGELN